MPPPPARRRSRRLEKKLHVGAFRAYGFPVRFRLVDSTSARESDDFWAAFITQLVERRGLAFGGGEHGYITRSGAGSATEADREAVLSWLRAHPCVAEATIGALEDAWYA